MSFGHCIPISNLMSPMRTVHVLGKLFYPETLINGKRTLRTIVRHIITPPDLLGYALWTFCCWEGCPSSTARNPNSSFASITRRAGRRRTGTSRTTWAKPGKPSAKSQKWRKKRRMTYRTSTKATKTATTSTPGTQRTASTTTTGVTSGKQQRSISRRRRRCRR